MKPNSMDPAYDPFLDEKIKRPEAAKFAKLAVITLDVMRSGGLGPKFTRPPGTRSIFYTRRWILDWQKQGEMKPVLKCKRPLQLHSEGSSK